MLLKPTARPRLSLENYTNGILQGDRIILGQAITLIESNLKEDRQMSLNLIDNLLEKTGNSVRIGITGVPGVGKSTFIESFGKYIIGQKKKVAVLTVDPSSTLTKGSILGDKTRMNDLSKNPMAFIRPSSSGTMLGGVAAKTRETILLCEAAGYEVIIIETVGVGQSETAVKNMTDFFLLLMLAGAGDELQGIKKGIMEMADAIVITKADGDNMAKAKSAQADYQQSFHLSHVNSSGWHPPVLTSSALHDDGMEDVWKMINKYKHLTQENNFFATNRAKQNVEWFHEYFDLLLKADINDSLVLKEKSQILEDSVRQLKLSPQTAAKKMLASYYQTIQNWV